MSIKDKYKVTPISPKDTYEWIVRKHYAKRVPSISYAFGLYSDELEGVCTFGAPARVMNDGECIFKSYRVKTVELNRLVINNTVESNAASYFVSSCLKFLPKPICVVSYSDYTFGHVGYIYQATNWVYTGLNQIHERQIFYKGKEVHPRTACSMGHTNISEWAKKDSNVELGEYTKKHRYFQFLGNKKEVKKMKNDLIYHILPYPKGETKRYDASYRIKNKKLF